MKKVLLFCLIVTLVCCAVVPVFAKEDAKTNGYNVVIAMDSSRSLEYTDPNNYRYNAVNLFIQLLANKQNKLGCLSFSGDVSNQQHLTDINKSSDKQSVYNALTQVTAFFLTIHNKIQQIWLHSIAWPILFVSFQILRAKFLIFLQS